MTPKTIPPIRQRIVATLAANGGSYRGTCRLAQELNEDVPTVTQALHRARRAHIITSLHTHGGCGKLALHKLIAKGVRHDQPK